MAAGRIGHTLGALGVAAALFVPGVVHAPAAGAVTSVTGGRVTLQTPGRLLDQSPVSGPVAVPSGAVLTVSVTAGATPLEVFVRPCAAPDAPPTVLVLAAGETQSNTVITGPDPTCVSASGAARVVVDERGTVAGAPSPGALQYVPEATPLALGRGMLVFGETPLILPSRPATAGGVVIDVRAFAGTGSYITFYPCSVSRPLASDLLVTTAMGHGLVYSPLGPAGAGALCAYAPTPTVMTADIIGYLATDGPDPTRLPPQFTFGPGTVPPPGLVAGEPVRVLDTRPSTVVDPDTGDTVDIPDTKLAAGQVRSLALADHLSADTRSAVLNVTVTEPTGDGFVSVYPCDAARPTASNLNYVKAQTVANLVTVPVAADGTVCFYSQASTHLVVDLTGSFDETGGAGAHPVTPARLLDTREPNGVPTVGKQPGGRVLTLQVGGRGGVPTDATAVTLNVTATEPDAPGYLTVYPCDASQVPTASNLNYVAGQTVPNAVTVALSAAGTVCLYSQSTTRLVADVAMWFGFDEPAGFEELVPSRLLDTRIPIGVPAIAPLAGGSVLTLQVAGRDGVPGTGAEAAVLNVTVIDPVGPGYVTVYPCDAPERPTASNLNYVRAQTVPNQVTVKLSAAGTVCLYSQVATNLVADVAGYTTAVGEPGIVGTVG